MGIAVVPHAFRGAEWGAAGEIRNPKSAILHRVVALLRLADVVEFAEMLDLDDDVTHNSVC